MDKYLKEVVLLYTNIFELELYGDVGNVFQHLVETKGKSLEEMGKESGINKYN